MVYKCVHETCLRMQYVLSLYMHVGVRGVCMLMCSHRMHVGVRGVYAFTV